MSNYIEAGSIIAIATSLTFWQDAFGISNFAVGLLAALSANAFGAAIGAGIGGPLCDRFGRKAIYTYDLLVYMAGVLLAAFAVNFAMLLAAFVITGIAVGAGVPASWTYIAEQAPTTERARHVGMFSYGADKQTARVAGEFYLNAVNVMRGAESVSRYQPIDEAEKFRIEYWALEEAKLARRPEPKPLATRIALVTGAASGIGKAIARRLAAEGACVVVADRDGAKAAEVAAEIGSADVAVGITADVTDEGQVQAAVDAAVLAFGGLDLVVNNAGLSLSKSLLETTEADWDLQHDVMAKGSFLVSKAAARALIDQRMGGDILYISSKNSVFAGPNNIAYSAAKADQAHQVRLLAAELGEHGVKVNGINPDGVVRGSGIFAGGWGAQRAAVYGVEESELGTFYAQRTLLKREVLPEHIANAAFALCSADFSHTTGLHVPVDAGVAAAFLR
ncbi:SDR family oxidoreductase [Nocardia abscessus]|uniref:SDR family oxidoreductase n=1 Tax=Nocardia abscessus TaxID=120957 RepID=UPI00313DD31A